MGVSELAVLPVPHCCVLNQVTTEGRSWGSGCHGELAHRQNSVQLKAKGPVSLWELRRPGDAGLWNSPLPILGRSA